MTTALSTPTVLRVRCRAFSNEGVRWNNVMIANDGSVRAWDSVAGHYTHVHCLRGVAQARLRRLAETTTREYRITTDADSIDVRAENVDAACQFAFDQSFDDLVGYVSDCDGAWLRITEDGVEIASVGER